MRTSRDKRECVEIFGKMLRKRERCVMVDCILWHKLFQCFDLTVGIRETEKNGDKLKMRNRKRTMENYRIEFMLQFSE